MKKYCFDTSGISNPLEQMPEDIHVSMWNDFETKISSGIIAVTTEIYEEMSAGIYGNIGIAIKESKSLMVLEIGDPSWNWNSYIGHVSRMKDQYQKFISEYCGGSKKTVCLNDISIIALAKTLNLPVVSMENLLLPDQAKNKKRIPNICQYESVPHLRFSDFLRQEKVKI